MSHPCDCVVGTCTPYGSYETCMGKQKEPRCSDCCKVLPALLPCCLPGCVWCIGMNITYCGSCGCCGKYSYPKYGGLAGYIYHYCCMFLIPCCYPKDTLEFINNENSELE